MRIYEIEDMNKSVITLYNIEIEFSDRYKHIELAYRLLKKFTGRDNDPLLKTKCIELQNDIKKFIDIEFYPDADINLLKHMAFDLYKKLDNFS